MTFSQLVDLFYQKIQETSNNTLFPLELVKRWLNEGYMHVSNYAPWRWLRKKVEMSFPFTYITEESQGKELHVQDTSKFQKGMEIWIGKAFLERGKISSIDYQNNVIHLVEDVQNQHSQGEWVCTSKLFLPYDLKQIDSVVVYDLSRKKYIPLKYKNGIEFERFSPVAGVPLYYTHGEYDTTEEGKGEDYTCEEGTGAKTVICSSLKGQEDGYYKGWNLYNKTRGKVSRVKEYDALAHNISLWEPIEGQTSQDLIFLQRDTSSILVHPIPNDKYTIILHYIHIPNPLTEDYHVPLLKNPHLIVDYALAEAYASDKNPKMASLYREKFYRQIELLRKGELSPTFQNISFFI